MLSILKTVLLGLLLGVQSYWDLRYRELPFVISLLGGMTGIGMSIYEGRGVVEIIIALLPGMIALFLGKITRQSIGYGDGIFILMLGCYVSLEEVLLLCMFASFFAGVVGLVLLVVLKKRGTYEIPFVPFLWIAWMIRLIFT